MVTHPSVAQYVGPLLADPTETLPQQPPIPTWPGETEEREDDVQVVIRSENLRQCDTPRVFIVEAVTKQGRDPFPLVCRVEFPVADIKTYGQIGMYRTANRLVQAELPGWTVIAKDDWFLRDETEEVF